MGVERHMRYSLKLKESFGSKKNFIIPKTNKSVVSDVFVCCVPHSEQWDLHCKESVNKEVSM